ncbi:MAG: hypothetical protein RI965_424 [Bacteroidota bacterium]|jgi:uncharacterized protein
MLEIIGYLSSLLIGISLGMIGGGGSILTVPVLVYLLGVDPVTATAYSLFVVGVTSLIGAIPKYRNGMIQLRTAVVFGIPSIVSVYLTRRFLVPSIPQHILTIGNFELTKPVMLMLLFSILMVVASYSMIKGNGKEEKVEPVQHFNYPMITLEGLVVGVLTGLVGAGGGFLIIPALVIFTKLDMKKAIGTSLLIIAAKSLIGFLGDLSHLQVKWTLLLDVTVLAIIGILIGNQWSKKMDAKLLKKIFGWFVLVLGIYIIVKELFLK